MTARLPASPWTILFLSVAVIVSGLADVGHANQVVSRFEYKYSFKPPYLAQKDGSVPFWEYGGSKSTTFVLIAPAGSVFST
jgi:mannose-binding lectin 1